MFKWRIFISLLTVVLLGSRGVCIRSHSSERLLPACSRRVLAKKQISNRTFFAWLDARTIILVTGAKEYFHSPDEWKGKVERFDTLTGRRLPDAALTRLLNGLQAQPMNLEAGPGSKWLLWTVTHWAGDHYPVPLVSSVDGTRHYEWGGDKFNEKFWLNSHQWISEEHYRNDENARSLTPNLNVYDAERGHQVRSVRVGSQEAHKLLRGMQPDSKNYIVEGGASDGNKPVRLEVYDASAYSPPREPAPLRVIPIALPSSWNIAGFKVSPDHQHMLYMVEYEQSSPARNELLPWSRPVKASKHKLTGLWTSRADGTQLHEVGHKECSEEYELSNTHWLADNQHLSWEDAAYVYTVPVE